mmetsp:Transcript_5162/g.7939  ORF Transcript_5162/g.7939 Transcript_5162/m.7939 type:complete len:207 (+) Transcript_5162:2498-3118(+)
MPSQFDVSITDFMDPYWTSDSGLSLGEQLYTPKGSQSVATGQYVVDMTHTDVTKFNESMLVQVYSNSASKDNLYYRRRAVWTAKQAPGFTMRDRAGGTPTLAVSLPSYARMTEPNSGLNDTVWERMYIKLKDPSNTDDIKKVLGDIKATFSAQQANNMEIFNYYDDTDTIEQVTSILNIIFNVIIAITMFLCFFSLAASMSANLLD